MFRSSTTVLLAGLCVTASGAFAQGRAAPATQARDLALLQSSYAVDSFDVYNFFPKTPHIETLAVLKHK